MSCQSISLTLGAPSPPSQSTYMVGNAEIASQFSQLIQKHGSTARVETDPLAQENRQLIFGRDSRVTGLNNVHLLPYSIQDPLLEGRFKALLPSSSDRFVENTVRNNYGEGLSKESADAALAYAQQHHLPHRRMLSSVEGGNSYVFFGSDDRPKAIVGIHSLALTIIGLEEQDYFRDNQDALQTISDSKKAPSDDAVRAARNMSLYAEKRVFDGRHADLNAQRQTLPFAESLRLRNSLEQEERQTIWRGSEAQYRKLLTAPITEKDRAHYCDSARVWEAKTLLARQVIAGDLHVSLENIAFVPQTRFHIDMEMFVAPNGDDVYVDETAYQPSVIQALKTIGCNAISLPGIYEVSNEPMNFMNGVFVAIPSGPLFVTNGVRRKHLRLLDLFEQALLQTKPSFKIDFLDDTLQYILTHNYGGIHCLTWEKPNYNTPLDIILSYTADEPIPEQKVRKEVSAVLPVSLQVKDL